MSAPLQVGMIGTGWMGDAIAPDFATCSDVELVAVAGRDVSKTTAFASRHGIPKVLTARDLIQAPDVQLVYIATTHDSHYELARTALELGKPVLVEKAFTANFEQAEALIRVAKDSGLFLMEAMWMRFNPVIRRLTALLAEGAIGEPRSLQASMGFAIPPANGSRFWDPARAGGSLLDQGVYPLAFADLVFGEPEELVAKGSHADQSGTDVGVDSEVSAMLTYGTGQHAGFSTSIRSWLPLGATVAGPEGWISIGPAFWCPSTLTLNKPNTEPSVEDFVIEGNGYVPMLREMAKAVRQGDTEHALSDHMSTLRIMRTVDRVAAALSPSEAGAHL